MADIGAIEFFVDPVVKEVQSLLDLTTPSGVDSDKYTDPKVLSCAVSSFSQCENYIKRKILRTTYLERYTNVQEEISLKQTPVKKVNLVKFRYSKLIPPQYYSLVLDQDYCVEGDSILISKSSILDHCPADFLAFRSQNILGTFEVSYSGGWNLSTESPELHSGLVLQTVCNYHRKEELGYSVVSRKGSEQVQIPIADAGIIQSAALSWDSLIYYGSGESL